MKYPTLEEVEKATRIELATWYRFLDSPGMIAIGTQDFDRVLLAEKKIMDRICDRFMELGGFTPGISKSIGWNK